MRSRLEVKRELVSNSSQFEIDFERLFVAHRTLLLDLCRRHETRPVRRLEYRALHPVFHTERFTVNGNPGADGGRVDLWTANAAGICAMTGTAAF